MNQQVMGAQSIATTTQGAGGASREELERSRGFLDMDGETAGRSQDEGQGLREPPVGTGLRNPRAQLNGTAAGSSMSEERPSRVGGILSEVSAAMQGVVKASGLARTSVGQPSPGPGSAGTEATVQTTETGYVTALSEGDGNPLQGGAPEQSGPERFSRLNKQHDWRHWRRQLR